MWNRSKQSFTRSGMCPYTRKSALQVFLCVFILIVELFAFGKTAAVTGDVSTHGPQGVLDLVQRWRDAIGTATQVWSQGRASKFSTLNTLRSGALSAFYRSILSSHVPSASCEARQSVKCEVAINGFGTIGEVHYVFNSSQRNIQGRSTQVMVACRCLSKECRTAILMRPTTLITNQADGSSKRSKQKVCLYEAVDGQFSDCSSEILRVTYRERLHPPDHLGERSFNYAVVDGDKSFWNASGQRGWTKSCSEEEVSSLSSIDLSTIKEGNISFNQHSLVHSEGSCRSSGKVQYFRSTESSNDECIRLYDYAAASAAHLATQQDEIAIGGLESSYLTLKSPLIEDTELTLICAAVSLGVLFVWSMHRKLLSNKGMSTPRFLLIICGQMFALFLLEALPMHVALWREMKARNWHSIFAFAEGSIVVAEDQQTPQGSSASGSVLILTAVVGDVKYLHTRERLVAGLAVIFDLLATGIIAASVICKLRDRSAKKDPKLAKLSSHEQNDWKSRHLGISITDMGLHKLAARSPIRRFSRARNPAKSSLHRGVTHRKSVHSARIANFETTCPSHENVSCGRSSEPHIS